MNIDDIPLYASDKMHSLVEHFEGDMILYRMVVAGVPSDG